MELHDAAHPASPDVVEAMLHADRESGQHVNMSLFEERQYGTCIDARWCHRRVKIGTDVMTFGNVWALGKSAEGSLVLSHRHHEGGFILATQHGALHHVDETGSCFYFK